MTTATANTTETIRAMWADEYGAPNEVLHMKSISKPGTDGGKVVVRVLAVSTHAGDWHLIHGTPYLIRLIFGGLRRPKVNIPGCEMCGVIDAIPENHTEFAIGDCVFGDVSGCGFGAFAEFIAVPPQALVKKPDNVSVFQAAACATSALAALQAVRDHGAVAKGAKVLINGASGGVGSYAVQIAKHFGAHVTAVCQESKVPVVKSFGADVVIDYTKQDVVKSGQKFDVIVDTACFRSPFEYVPIIEKNGRYLMVGGDTSRLFQMMVAGPWISMTSGVSAKFVDTKPKKEDMLMLRNMLEDGSLVPYIDKTFAFEDLPQAVTYVEDRKVVGKVAIQVQTL